MVEYSMHFIAPVSIKCSYLVLTGARFLTFHFRSHVMTKLNPPSAPIFHLSSSRFVNLSAMTDCDSFDILLRTLHETLDRFKVQTVKIEGSLGFLADPVFSGQPVVNLRLETIYRALQDSLREIQDDKDQCKKLFDQRLADREEATSSLRAAEREAETVKVSADQRLEELNNSIITHASEHKVELSKLHKTAAIFSQTEKTHQQQRKQLEEALEAARDQATKIAQEHAEDKRQAELTIRSQFVLDHESAKSIENSISGLKTSVAEVGSSVRRIETTVGTTQTAIASLPKQVTLESIEAHTSQLSTKTEELREAMSRLSTQESLHTLEKQIVDLSTKTDALASSSNSQMREMEKTILQPLNGITELPTRTEWATHNDTIARRHGELKSFFQKALGTGEEQTLLEAFSASLQTHRDEMPAFIANQVKGLDADADKRLIILLGCLSTCQEKIVAQQQNHSRSLAVLATQEDCENQSNDLAALLRKHAKDLRAEISNLRGDEESFPTSSKRRRDESDGDALREPPVRRHKITNTSRTSPIRGRPSSEAQSDLNPGAANDTAQGHATQGSATGSSYPELSPDVHELYNRIQFPTDWDHMSQKAVAFRVQLENLPDALQRTKKRTLEREIELQVQSDSKPCFLALATKRAASLPRDKSVKFLWRNQCPSCTIGKTELCVYFMRADEDTRSGDRRLGGPRWVLHERVDEPNTATA